MTAGTRAANLALICDCDGVLIDSEAVAARMLVQELEARWPGANVGPVVLPLLGLRIESVLTGTAMQLGKSLLGRTSWLVRDAEQLSRWEDLIFDPQAPRIAQKPQETPPHG